MPLKVTLFPLHSVASLNIDHLEELASNTPNATAYSYLRTTLPWLTSKQAHAVWTSVGVKIDRNLKDVPNSCANTSAV